MWYCISVNSKSIILFIYFILKESFFIDSWWRKFWLDQTVALSPFNLMTNLTTPVVMFWWMFMTYSDMVYGIAILHVNVATRVFGRLWLKSELGNVHLTYLSFHVVKTAHCQMPRWSIISSLWHTLCHAQGIIDSHVQKFQLFSIILCYCVPQL